VTDHFKKVCQKVYWILRSMKPHESQLQKVVIYCASHSIWGYAGGGADVASQRRLNMTFRACLRYIHSLRSLDHISYYLETSVMRASRADNARIQVLSFLYKVLHVRQPCYLFSLAMSQSFVVLGCRAWNELPHGMEFLPTWASFVSAVRRMVRGVDASI
jgi:hypothetical protein